MTYNVFSGTLNPTHLLTYACHCSSGRQPNFAASYSEYYGTYVEGATYNQQGGPYSSFILF